MMHLHQTQGGRSDQADSRSRRARRARGDGGVALVEFAIIAPLLFALMLGTFTGGISLSRKNSMTNATREGARLGATLLDSGSWASSVATRVGQLAAGDLSSSQICVKLVRKDSSGSTDIRTAPDPCPLSFPAEPDIPAGVQAGECVVKVWAGRTSDLEVIFFSRTLQLRADAVARFERGGTGSCS